MVGWGGSGGVAGVFLVGMINVLVFVYECTKDLRLVKSLLALPLFFEGMIVISNGSVGPN